MTVKYKVSELAKDFNVSAKEISAILEEKTGESKKSGSALTENELDIIFEILTTKHQVKSFDEYFKTGEATREAAAQKRQAEKDKKLAEQMAILEQLKAAAEAEKKAEIKEVTFKAHLHCASCVKKVQENIAFEKGVKDLKVSLADQTIAIRYDASKTSEQVLKAAIQKLGIPVSEK